MIIGFLRRKTIMRKVFNALGLGFILIILVSVFVYADNYDFPNMTKAELEEVRESITEEIKANHTPNSSQETAVEEITKEFVEAEYGTDNVSWAWIDYTYTKDWDFYTMSTHADITKHDGGEARYNVYSEVIASDDAYHVVYVKIGNEELLNKRNTLITDQRILNSLGINSQPTTTEESADVQSESADAPSQDATSPNTETEKATEQTIPLAKKGDTGETVLTIQQMLTGLGYLTGTPDGSFGDITEKAVIQFQSENGFVSDGIVTQPIYEALQTAYETESLVSDIDERKAEDISENKQELVANPDKESTSKKSATAIDMDLIVTMCEKNKEYSTRYDIVFAEQDTDGNIVEYYTFDYAGGVNPRDMGKSFNAIGPLPSWFYVGATVHVKANRTSKGLKINGCEVTQIN